MNRPRAICHHHLFVDRLDAGSTILDLGAYQGEFAREIHETTGARVVAVEANPETFRALSSLEGIECRNLAVGGHEGTLTLHVGGNPLGASLSGDHPFAGSATVEVQSTTLAHLIAEEFDGHLDLLKSNIEGAEIAMLDACDDATLQAIDQITIQFHDFIPELGQAEDVRRIKRRLGALGFGEILFKAPNKDVLFVNLERGVLSRTRLRLERAVVRGRQYLRAVQKKLAR